jgi:hypothetical protein
MSYPNDVPAAAWYPDPQSPGHVRWWDGTKWTEHVSVPAAPAELQAVAIEASVPRIAEADAALAAADAEHASAERAPADHSSADHSGEPTYIGRHAAGPQPAPRQTSNVPRIRPRERVPMPVESLLYA